MCIDARLILPVAAGRVEREGGADAGLEGTLAAPSVQGHGLPLPQELWPDQSFFEPLVAGNPRPLWLVFLHSSTCSGA